MTHAVRTVAVAVLVALALCVPVQAQEIPLASNFQFMVLRTVMPLQWDQDDLQSYLRERFEKDGWRFTSSGARTETLYCEFVFRGAGRGGDPPRCPVKMSVEERLFHCLKEAAISRPSLLRGISNTHRGRFWIDFVR